MLFPVIHKFDSFEKVDFNINVHGDYKSYEYFEFFEILKILNFKIFFFILEFWKFWNFMKTEIFENFEILWKFWIFWKISEFSLIDDEVQVFRINIKLLSNPIAELKLRYNNILY